MPLAPGTRLGSFEVTSALGAGGMGEVYRARDLKLGRDVAIKILPAAFRSDPDRLARFEREARALAAINHPNIAAIYGIDDQAGTHALVLELVEGETLAACLRRTPMSRTRPSVSPGKLPALSKRPTRKTSSIAISSPPTS
jgi:serine/threonine protein kinase